MTEQQHLKQARHNLRLFDQLDVAQFPDWAATLLFYCAVHHLEACLIRIGYRRPATGSHSERLQAMVNCGRIPAATQHLYRRLKQDSTYARYEDWRKHGITDAYVRQRRQSDVPGLVRALGSIK